MLEFAQKEKTTNKKNQTNQPNPLPIIIEV